MFARLAPRDFHRIHKTFQQISSRSLSRYVKVYALTSRYTRRRVVEEHLKINLCVLQEILFVSLVLKSTCTRHTALLHFLKMRSALTVLPTDIDLPPSPK